MSGSRRAGGLAKRFVPALFLIALVLLGLGIYSDGDALLAVLRDFDLRYLAAALGLASLNYVIRFVRWEYYLRALDIRLALRESAPVFFAGLSMSITPGKFGELLKCFLLRDRQGVRIALTAPVVVAERYTDIVAVVLLLGTGVARFAVGRTLFFIGVAVAGVVFLAMAFSDTFVERVTAVLTKTIFKGRSFEGVKDSAASFRLLLRGRHLLVGTVLGALAWFAECMAFLLVFKGLGVTSIGIGDATFTYAAATLAGALSMLPGGLGVTEGSMTGILVLMEISKDLSAAATLIIRACTLWWGVLVGLVFYVALRGSASRAMAEVEEDVG